MTWSKAAGFVAVTAAAVSAQSTEATLNGFLGGQEIPLNFNGVDVTCNGLSVGDLDIQTSIEGDVLTSVTSATGVTFTCSDSVNGSIPTVFLSSSDADLSLSLDWGFDDITRSITNNVTFPSLEDCIAGMDPKIVTGAGDEADFFANAGFATNICSLVLTDTLLDEIVNNPFLAQFHVRAPFETNINQAAINAEAALNVPEQFEFLDIVGILETGPAFIESLQNIPLIEDATEAIEGIIEQVGAIGGGQEPNIGAILQDVTVLIQLLSGDFDFELPATFLGEVLATIPALQEEINATNLLAVYDVIFSFQEFVDLLPDPALVEQIRDVLENVLPIVLNIFLPAEEEIIIELEPLLRKLQGRKLQGTGGILDGISGFLSQFTFGDVLGFLNDAGLGGAVDLSLIIALVPLDTTMDLFFTVLGESTILEVAQFLQFDPTDPLFIILGPFLSEDPFLGVANLTDAARFFFFSISDIVDDILDASVSFNLVDNLADGYADLAGYIGVLLSTTEPEISALLIGIFQARSLAPLASFLTLDTGAGLNATLASLDIDFPFELAVSESFFAGASTISPADFVQDITVVVGVDVETLAPLGPNGTLVPFGETITLTVDTDILQQAGFTIVQKLDDVFNFDLNQIVSVPALVQVGPDFVLCGVGSVGVAHLAHVSIISSTTVLSSNIFLEGFAEDLVLFVGELYNNLIGTILDSVLIKTVINEVFFVDVGDACDTGIVNNDDDDDDDDDDFIEQLGGFQVVVPAAVGGLCLISLVAFFVFAGGAGALGGGADDDEEEEEENPLEAKAAVEVKAEEAV